MMTDLKYLFVFNHYSVIEGSFFVRKMVENIPVIYRISTFMGTTDNEWSSKGLLIAFHWEQEGTAAVSFGLTMPKWP